MKFESFYTNEIIIIAHRFYAHRQSKVKPLAATKQPRCPMASTGEPVHHSGAMSQLRHAQD